MPRPSPLLLLLGVSCGMPPAEAPPACAERCDAAGVLYGGCLEAWGVDWSAAGYADEAQFRNSCETWGWEMAHLEADAVEQGTLSAPGWLAQTCQDRRDAFAAEDAACSTYTDIAWNDVPWSPEDTGP